MRSPFVLSLHPGIAFAALAPLLLAACSMAPGMNINSEISQPAVAPVLREITPKLLQEERDARDQAIDQTISTLFGDPKPYRIGINDVISVVLFGQTEMTTNVSVVMAPIPNSVADSLVTSGYAVDSEGQIHLQYVGAVTVAGLTEREMHDVLLREYSKYVKNPELSARVQSYRSKRLYVDGEIKTPGVLPIIDIPMTLPEALSRAGGATTLGDLGSVDISRGGKSYLVNVPQLTAHGVDPSRILLQDGDLVRVPPREEGKVFVLGEVTKPTTVLPHNGRLTLNEALGEAGGVSPSSAEPKQIYVVRHASDQHPQVYHLDAASPVALALAESFELRPKDVVYVDATELTRWNRVINLVLPTAQLVVDTKYMGMIK
jgi:polysaccharide export outer membrane protein